MQLAFVMLGCCATACVCVCLVCTQRGLVSSTRSAPRHSSFARIFACACNNKRANEQRPSSVRCITIYTAFQFTQYFAAACCEHTVTRMAKTTTKKYERKRFTFF